MPIVVLSPYSGREVKVRDQDIGRSIRDEEGRIFYVLERSDGGGYYTSPTRVGGPKEEQRYQEMQQKAAQAGTHARQVQREALDATGRKRSTWRGTLILLLILLAVIALAYFLWQGLPTTAPGPTTPTPEQVEPEGEPDMVPDAVPDEAPAPPFDPVPDESPAPVLEPVG